MTAVLRWFAPGDIEHDLTDRIDNGDEPRFVVTSHAEQCSVGSSTIEVRDEAGDFVIVGLNAFNIVEEDSTGPDPYIYVGRFDQRRESRGEYRTGAARMIEADLSDVNAVASNYIVGDTEDADRPAEDHGERIAWLLGTAACNLITDDSLVLITSSKSMPAYDYTGMTPQQVIDDCARASGYDNFIWYDGTTDDIGLVYAASDGTWLTSDLRLSNVVAEVDDETTFYLNLDAVLTLDPTRVASRAFGRGDGVDGFRTNSYSEILHARRDVALDFPTVKTMGTLNTRLDRALAEDLATEEWTLKGSVVLPSTVASQFRAGWRVEVHATHLTGLQDDFTFVRLLSVTHSLITPTLYLVEFEAEVPNDAPPVEPVGQFQYVGHSSANTEYHDPYSASLTTLPDVPGVGNLLLAVMVDQADTDGTTWPAGWTEVDRVTLTGGGGLIGPGYATLRTKVSAGAADQSLLVIKGGSHYTLTGLVELPGFSTTIIDQASADNAADSLPPTPAIGPVTATADGQYAVGFALIAGISNTITLGGTPDWVEMVNDTAGASPTMTFAYNILDNAESTTLTATSNTTGGGQAYSAGIVVVVGP